MAGAATALWLGRAGLRVLLLDRAAFPRDKACGEGIMPAGVRVLSEMGLLPALREQGAVPFYGITFYDRHGCQASGTFPDCPDWPGLTIRRLRLDAFLLQQATATPGVEVFQEFIVTRVLQEAGRVYGVTGRLAHGPEPAEESFTAPITVGADGLHSLFHRLPQVRVRRPSQKRFGARAHLNRVEGLGPHVDVIAGGVGEVYVASQGAGTAMVALLLERRVMTRFRGDIECGFWETLHSIRPFSERVQKSDLVSSVMVAGPLGSRVCPSVGDGFLLIGDSAGALDPITGEGIALSLRSARLAASTVVDAFRSSDFGGKKLSDYDAGRKAMFRSVARLTDLLLVLSRHETLAHWAIRGLTTRPRALQRILSVAAGSYR